MALTAGGWLLLVGAQAAMALLGRLDGLPGSSCCACRPLLLARLEGQVGKGEWGRGEDMVEQWGMRQRYGSMSSVGKGTAMCVL